MPAARSALAVLLSAALLSVLAFAGPDGARADGPRPQGPVVLTVTGAIAAPGRGEGVDFDMAMLDGLPQARLVTHTDWTDGPQVFEGPRLDDLLAHVGAAGTAIRAVALNDYAITIPVSDARAYGVVLATRHNGDRMTVRDKGPIWIVYPHPDPARPAPSPHNEKSVWQLRRLDIR